MHTKTKTASIAIIAIVYLIAFFVGYLVFTRLKGDMSELWALFVADVVATVVVWFFGLVFKNLNIKTQSLKRVSYKSQ